MDRFLSTPSGWRATRQLVRIAGSVHISIHALRVEGDGLQVLHDVHLAVISIHALRVEGDSNLPWIGSPTAYFYPRPPGGGRLYRCGTDPAETTISIHALRVEGDLTRSCR